MPALLPQAPQLVAAPGGTARRWPLSRRASLTAFWTARRCWGAAAAAAEAARGLLARLVTTSLQPVETPTRRRCWSGRSAAFGTRRPTPSLMSKVRLDSDALIC